MEKILNKEFFKKNTIELAKNLIGKWIVTNINGEIIKAQISETEAYLGINDSACHTYKGKKTERTHPMWQDGGTIYIYLCYGLHYLFNIVSEKDGIPEAVLIRATIEANGPAKLTKYLKIDKSLNGLNITNCKSIWLEDDGINYFYTKDKRVGIDYALKKDKDAKLRFILKQAKRTKD